MRRSPPALGASGSVNASVIFNILHSPYSTVLIYGIIPMPAWALGGAWLAYDITGAMVWPCHSCTTYWLLNGTTSVQGRACLHFALVGSWIPASRRCAALPRSLHDVLCSDWLTRLPSASPRK